MDKIAFAKQTYLLNSATKSKSLPIGILKSQRNPIEGQWKFLTKLVMLPNSEIIRLPNIRGEGGTSQSIPSEELNRCRFSQGLEFPNKRLGNSFFGGINLSSKCDAWQIFDFGHQKWRWIFPFLPDFLPKKYQKVLGNNLENLTVRNTYHWKYRMSNSMYLYLLTACSSGFRCTVCALIGKNLTSKSKLRVLHSVQMRCYVFDVWVRSCMLSTDTDTLKTRHRKQFNVGYFQWYVYMTSWRDETLNAH